MPTEFPRAILIAVEGIDGAGKTTQVNLLRDALAQAGEEPLVSKEPTNGPWGRLIKQSAANGRMSLHDELQAFIHDRSEHVRDKILPALQDGRIVILDRYFYSSIAYQGARGADPNEIESEMASRFPVPDAVFVLDIDPSQSLFRISHSRKDTPNEFERLDGLSAARRIFRGLKGPHVYEIDGSVSQTAVHATMLGAFVEGPLKAKRCFKHYGCDDPTFCAWRHSNQCEWWHLRGKLRAARV
jgi:dTMP kinase